MQFFIVFLYLLVLLITLAIIGLVIYARWNYGILEKMLGPEKVVAPYFMGGSQPRFYNHVAQDEDLRRRDKYGDIYGLYEGRTPFLFISDVKLIPKILVKNFEHFHDKKVVEIGFRIVTDVIDTLDLERWKIVKKFVSPMLTPAKINGLYSPQLQTAVDVWFSKIRSRIENGDPKFVGKREFSILMADIMTRCFYGITISQDDDFWESLYLITYNVLEPNLAYTVGFTFPFIPNYIPVLPTKVMKKIENFFRDLIQTHKSKSASVYQTEFMNMIIEMMDQIDSEAYKKVGIDETTVLAQVLNFLMAGVEPTANTLAVTAYRLAEHPDVQDKLIEEVDSFLARHHGVVSPEFLPELHFLNAVVTESIRMTPITVRIERLCTKDFYDPESGLKIKKGVNVQIPLYPLHYDPRNFTDPYKFRPERFLSKTKAGETVLDKAKMTNVLTFGAGQHQCLGKKFGHTVALITFVHILKDFRFEMRDDTQLEFAKGQAFINVFKPFPLNLVARRG